MYILHIYIYIFVYYIYIYIYTYSYYMYTHVFNMGVWENFMTLQNECLYTTENEETLPLPWVHYHCPNSLTHPVFKPQTS